jgi:dihydroorotase
MKTIIRNGRVIDPSQKMDKKADVVIEDGRIADICGHAETAADEIIDAEGMWVVPGLIDLHVHFR